MKFSEEQQTKLEQAKKILKELGLPPAQYNDRSAWVFLALANVKPNVAWEVADAPLLATYMIMDFIRIYYAYNTSPTVAKQFRRAIPSQFEQARDIDRKRDNPAAPNQQQGQQHIFESVSISRIIE